MPASLYAAPQKGMKMIGHPLKIRELLDEVALGEILLPGSRTLEA